MARTAVIGAGPSGLTASMFLGQDTVIYESSDSVGGFAKSHIVGDWTFDNGPHIMFSKDKRILQFMIDSLGNNVHECRRNNRCIVGDQLVRYPIENDLAALGPDLAARCLIDMVEAAVHRRDESAVGNLDSWFRNEFGDALTDLYFKPYNEKVWKTPLDELSMVWADRIPKPPLADVISGALGLTKEGYLHQLNYQYPLQGGFQSIPQAWGALISDRISLRNAVVAIAKRSDGTLVIEAEQGSQSHERIISTMPVDRLLGLCKFDIPARIRLAASQLRVNPMLTVTLGVTGTDPNRITALYVPDPSISYNRMSFPGVFSPKNCPPGHYSIQAEVTLRPDDEPGSEEAYVAELESFLRRSGLLSDTQDIVFRHCEYYEHAYVVYQAGYEDSIGEVKEWFSSQGIQLHGRFGAFEYVNTDMCVFRSLELAARWLGHDDLYAPLERF